jgi:hypothetical protein
LLIQYIGDLRDITIKAHMLWYLTCVDFSCSILGIKSRNGGSFSTLMLLPDTLQVLENDLVASRQADRSIGSHDFNRLGTGKLCENSILFLRI